MCLASTLTLGYLANITNITINGQDRHIDGAVCKVKPYIPLLPPVSANTAEDSDVQQNTVDPPHFTLCSSLDHTRTKYPSIKCICANCTHEHNVFFRGCPVYKFESDVVVFRLKNGFTHKETRQEIRLIGFQHVSLF